MSEYFELELISPEATHKLGTELAPLLRSGGVFRRRCLPLW